MVYCDNNICQICKRGFETGSDLKKHVEYFTKTGKCLKMKNEFDSKNVSFQMDNSQKNNNVIDNQALAAKLVKILPKSNNQVGKVSNLQFNELLNKVTHTLPKNVSSTTLKPVSRVKAVNMQCHFCNLKFTTDSEFLNHLKSKEHLDKKASTKGQTKLFLPQNKFNTNSTIISNSKKIVVVPARVLANHKNPQISSSKNSSPNSDITSLPKFPAQQNFDRYKAPPWRISDAHSRHDEIPKSWECIQGHRYACPQCDAIFNDPIVFRDHLMNVHKYTRSRIEDDVLKVCGECNTGFTRYFDLAQHLQIQHSVDFGDEIDIDFGLHTVPELESDKNDKNKLKIDSDSDDEIEKLIISNLVVKNKKNVVETDNLIKLKDFKNVVEPDKPFKYKKCPLCIHEVLTPTLDKLKSHVKIAHLTSRFDGREFESVELLIHHLKTVFAEQNKNKCFCELCGLKFVNDSSLNFHMELHKQQGMNKTEVNKVLELVNNYKKDKHSGSKNPSPTPPKKKRKLIESTKTKKVPKLTENEILEYQVLIKADLEQKNVLDSILYNENTEIETAYNEIQKTIKLIEKRKLKEFDLKEFLLEDYGGSKWKSWFTIIEKIANHQFDNKEEMINEFLDHLVKAKLMVEQDYDMRESTLTFKNEAMMAIENLINACNLELGEKIGSRRRKKPSGDHNFGSDKGRVFRQLKKMLERGYFSPKVVLEKTDVNKN